MPRIDFKEAQDKIKAWVDTLDGGDMERLMTDVFPCKDVNYDAEADEMVYECDGTDFDFFAE